jgi:predicted MFS family arabinose efflux permease
MLWFFDDPNSPLSIVAICIACLGFYGLMTLGYIVVNKNCGCNVRGSVMGINCLFGALGILIVSKVGGIAHDKISSVSPFIGTAFCSLILFLVLLIPMVRRTLDSDDSLSHK